LSEADYFSIFLVMSKTVLLGVLGLMVVVFLAANYFLPKGRDTDDKDKPAPSENETVSLGQPPAMEIDQNKKYSAILRTSKGDIDLDLFADKTPVTVNNFVHLARTDFYNGTVFHRVIAGFMIQGGDPLGDGTGGPGYTFNDEPIEGEYSRGTVAMANSGPNSNGSQFFIMHQDYDLPKNYVIFGKVSKGLDVVDKIATAPVEDSVFGEKSRPEEPVKIMSVIISEK